MQSKAGSFLEACTGTLLGLCYAMPLNYIVCLANDIPMSLRNNAKLTFWMTIASVIRTYFWRRLFNWLPRWWRQLRCDHRYKVVDTCADIITWECPHCGKKAVDQYWAATE